MNREKHIETLSNTAIWDIIIIGGGATGLGTAVDAASRGYKTLLLERFDFAKGTSSRSTKLVHGGVRYLAQGDISLVLEALHERGLLKKNAPHLVKNQEFIIPTYKRWRGPFYALGMKVYDMMSGKLGLGPSERLSKKETLEAIPNLSKKGLLGGVVYQDGQFDDARLAINLAQTASEYGATMLNYIEVTKLLKSDDEMIQGVNCIDKETQKQHHIRGKVVINATGVFVDTILQMDNPKQPKIVCPSQGVHIVLESSFLQSDAAIMIPKTDDGRVLFAVPWHNKVVVGTTDTAIKEATEEPRALEQEVKFILKTAADYLQKAPKRKDVLSIFAGLRPLAAPQGNEESTKEISRGHKLMVSLSGLVTITGGKWTTYRKMAEDTINKAVMVAGLEEQKCVTKRLLIHGYKKKVDRNNHLYFYGSDKKKLNKLLKANPKLAEQLHSKLPFIKAQVVWAVRHEMARTVEDVLSRRTRALLLDAQSSIEMASEVAKIMAKELGKDNSWRKSQVKQYTELANGYLLK